MLPSRKTIILVHGCYWHRHPGCRYAYSPKSRVDFWEKKFSENIARDRRNMDELQSIGWRALVVWECELREPDELKKRLKDELN